MKLFAQREFAKNVVTVMGTRHSVAPAMRYLVVLLGYVPGTLDRRLHTDRWRMLNRRSALDRHDIADHGVNMSDTAIVVSGRAAQDHPEEIDRRLRCARVTRQRGRWRLTDVRCLWSE